jgi:replicative DNA helicase
MLDPEAWERVASAQLTPADFYTRPARACFKAITRLAEASAPFDAVSVAEALTPAELEECGGKPGFFALATAAGTSANAKHYARLIADTSQRRALIAAATQAAERAYTEDAAEVAPDLASALDAITQGRGLAGYMDARFLLGRVVEGLERRHNGEARACVATGLADLDHILGGGFGPGEMVILGARPSQGKTALALGIARHVAERVGPVLAFSLEMPGDSLWERIVASESRVSLHKVRTATGKIDEGEWPRLSAAIARLTEIPLFVSDQPAMSLSGIKALARRLKREQGALSLIVLDYLQLLSPEGRAESRNMELSQMSRQLKILAMELACPVLCLSQLNRQLESRSNKRPTLADLRESGSLEQDADTVCFLYRDEVYNQDSKDRGTAEIIIGKQRNGPIGTVRAAWLAEINRFADLAPAWEERPL